MNNLENTNTNTIRDLASVNSLIQVLRNDQQRLLSAQSDQQKSQERQLIEIKSSFRDGQTTNQLQEARTLDDLNHRINTIESSLNNKFDTLSLKLTNQIQKIERMIIEERKTNADLINNSLTRFESKINSLMDNNNLKNKSKFDKIVENSKSLDENVDYLMEKLKSFEGKTSKRLRSLHED